MITHTRVHFSTLILFSKYELRDFAFSARDSIFRALHVFNEEPVSLLDRQSKLFHVSMWRVDIC